MAEAVSFETIDYCIFILLLSLSACIGVYFGFYSRKQETSTSYLYGNRKMQAVPVGLSLYSSAMSAISIIGVPYEIYNFGTHFLTSILGLLIGMFILWYTVLPVFCGNLNIKTPYEYFEQRFDYRIRMISTFIYILHTLMLMPITLYAPSAALSQVTQIPVLVCTTLIGGICILYTTIGGFKTVIWTDTVQATLMLLACLAIAVVGVAQAGGFPIVWAKAQQSDILSFFNMDPSPLIRITFWTSTIGGAFIHIGHAGCTAGALQRYMSVRGEKEARISTAIGAAGTAAIWTIGGIIGLTMYATFFKCDPELNGDIKSANQITSYFVTRTTANIPGFNGFFMAGLVSAALSTLSSELNTVGGLIYHDFILKFYKKQSFITKGAFIMKIIVLINGVIYLCIVPFVQLPHIYEVALSMGGITYGAKIGILALGLFFPKINTKGVIFGVIASISIMIWLNGGAHNYNIKSYYQYEHSTENCPLSNVTASIVANVTAANIPTSNFTISSFSSTTVQTLQRPELEDISFLYRISVFYYGIVGTIITMLVAIVVSYFTGSDDMNKIDPLLVSPLVRRYVQKQQNTSQEMEEMFNENSASKVVITLKAIDAKLKEAMK